jgi:molybdopterin adenylyltransferase
VSARTQEIGLRFGILTISDRSYHGLRPDTSGPALSVILGQQGWQVVHEQILPDDLPAIQKALVSLVEQGNLDVILTTGGTGFGLRDITPEATQAVIERSAPGLAEAMRSASLRETPHAMLSRGVAGIRGHTLIVNLPGSPRAATQNLDIIIPVLPHAVQLLRGDPHSEEGHQAKC